MKRVTLTAFMVCAAWLSFGQTARFGDLNRNSVVVTSAPPQSVVSVNGQTGAVVVTAAQIGALTNEQDLAALRTYHYGSPDIVESPAEWFTFDSGTGTITGFNWATGREHVVIPWQIGGVSVVKLDGFVFTNIKSVIAPKTVTSIGDGAFSDCNFLTSVAIPQATSIGNSAFFYCSSLTSVTIPQATSIGDNAFYDCSSLTSVAIPQTQTIGSTAFGGCGSLTSVHMGQNAPAEATDVFANITPPPTVYVDNPQATGWGATWNGAPVVRPNLYGSNVTAQAFTLGGDTITEWPTGGGATNITDGVTSGTYSEATRTIDISNLLAGVSAELPDGIVTNGMGGMLATTNAAGEGYVRFSGSGGPWRNSVTIGNHLYFDNWSGRLIFADGSGLDMSSMYFAAGTGGFRYWNGAQVYSLRSDFGNVSVPNGNLTVAGTNTAAVVRSTGGYIIGPTISGKQAQIFTDGTNCFFVNVNSVTNALTTN